MAPGGESERLLLLPVRKKADHGKKSSSRDSTGGGVPRKSAADSAYPKRTPGKCASSIYCERKRRSPAELDEKSLSLIKAAKLLTEDSRHSSEGARTFSAAPLDATHRNKSAPAHGQVRNFLDMLWCPS